VIELGEGGEGEEGVMECEGRRKGWGRGEGDFEAEEGEGETGAAPGLLVLVVGLGKKV
jgi:hypothetical protein